MILMDDSAPTHKRRTLIKTYKNVLPQKWTLVSKVLKKKKVLKKDF